MTQPRLALVDHEPALREAARSFVEKLSPLSDVRTLRDEGPTPGYRIELWRAMVDLDWVGLAVDPEAGGAGGSAADLGILVQELGRNLVCVPLRAACEVLRILVGAKLPNTNAAARSMISGDRLTVFAHQERARHGVQPLTTIAHRTGAGYSLQGTKRFIAFGANADAFVVSALFDDRTGLGLFLLERNHPGVTTQTVRLMDVRPRGHLELDDVQLPDTALIAHGPVAEQLVDEALEQATLLAAAESLGATQAALDITVGYLRTREQFGVAIGTFQALQHRAARMHVATELAESALMAALRECDVSSASQARIAISVAKAATNDAFSLVAREGVQLHGGMGMTDEASIGLYLKRMMVACTEYGDARYHARRVAGDALNAT